MGITPGDPGLILLNRTLKRLKRKAVRREAIKAQAV